MGDTTRGLYHKYNVSRTDGTDKPGGKHENCELFVLDLTHDPHALPAIMAYIGSCKDEYDLLAMDLIRKLMTTKFGWTEGVKKAELVTIGDIKNLAEAEADKRKIGWIGDSGRGDSTMYEAACKEQRDNFLRAFILGAEEILKLADSKT